MYKKTYEAWMKNAAWREYEFVNDLNEDSEVIRNWMDFQERHGLESVLAAHQDQLLNGPPVKRKKVLKRAKGRK